MRPMVQQPGQLISTQGLQAVYTQQGAPYGSIAYAYPQDAFGTPMAGGATLQPDGTLVYQDGSVVLQQMTAGQVAMGPPGMGAGGKLMQVAGAKPGGGGAGGGGVSWSAAGKADGNGASGEMLAASNGGGLVQVMDAEGQVYYYNPNET